MGAEVQTNGKPIDSLFERVLSMNILSSDYFKELYRLKTYHEVVDEIYNHVDNVEPWMSGNCRGTSTAFCLLYKFFTMKLTVKQMQGLLNHTDSPYIRAIGFLYLRYLADPKTLWQWFEPYIEDDEEFSPGSNGRMTTMGVYIRDLLLEQHYFHTIFPRIPVPIMRQITANLERLKLPTKGSGATAVPGRIGSEETARRPPSVKAALSVSFGQRAPHRASTRDSSPVRRSFPSSNGTNERSSDRAKDKDRSRDRDRDRDRDYERERPRSRESSYDRSRDRDRTDRRDRDRDYERDRRDRDHERDRDRHSSRDRDRRRDRRDRSPERRHRSRSRSRSRSPLRRSRSPLKRSGSPRSPAKEKAAISANLLKLRDLYGDASGKNVEENHSRVKDSNSEEVIRLGGSTWSRICDQLASTATQSRAPHDNSRVLHVGFVFLSRL